MAILELKDVIVDYGIVRALKGIDIQVEEGTIVALLGANGAGKTTTIKAISGTAKVKSGSIVFNNHNIENIDSYKITAKGVLQSPEGRMIFQGLTVEENLRSGAYSLKPLKKTVVDENGLEKKVKVSVNQQVKETLQEVFEYFPILEQRRKQQASTLSGGEQQMLAIGRALMGRPKLLLLDEPSLGLAPLVIRDIFEIVKEIKKRGQTILIVEQNAYQTLKIADYAYIMELGKIKYEGKSEELLKDNDLVNAYLGSQE